MVDIADSANVVAIGPQSPECYTRPIQQGDNITVAIGPQSPECYTIMCRRITMTELL